MLPVPFWVTDSTTRQRSPPVLDGTVNGLPWSALTWARVRVGMVGPQSPWSKGSLLRESSVPAALLNWTK
jgi:hypothetical protein